MTERVIIAGFGGQGIMMLGKLLAGVALREDKQVTFFPTYGAEVRGGTAHCHVVLSTEPIYSPIVEQADTLIIMNQPSYDKFRPRLRAEGLLILNASMAEPAEEAESASNATCMPIPATQFANDLGNVRVANVIMLGAWSAMKGMLPPQSILATLEAQMTGRKAHLLELNRRAFQNGVELAARFAQASSAEPRRKA